ncbi:MAG: transposase, partial [Hydrogenophilales bacterium 12-63-5]
MNPLLQAVSNAPPIPHPVISSVTNDAPETRVSLAFVEHRINVYLRFGHPVRELRLNRWRRYAVFTPAAVFCRVRW